MPGVGLYPKIKWLLPVVGALLLLSIGRGAYLAQSFCFNIDLLRLKAGGDAQCVWVQERNNGDAVPQKMRMVWLRGNDLWAAGNLDQAMVTWQEAPQYAGAMLTNWVQNGRLTDADTEETSLVQALTLDPNTLEISEVASSKLFAGRRWETAYAAFMMVHQAAPGNAVATAALALAGQELNQPVDEALRLIDTAVTEAPDNLYVLRYGLRLMQRMPAFGAERTAQLAALAAAQLPQDFEFTFGVANAFRNLGDLETAVHYNLMALEISPLHPWANLQQIEMIQQQGELQNLEPWLQQAIDNRVKDRPDYYRRLLAVLVEANAFQTAEYIYCDGLSQNITSDALLQTLENGIRARLKDTDCLATK